MDTLSTLASEEPKVRYAQESGRMLLSVELAGLGKLAGRVSYPYLPQEQMQDNRNGIAEVMGFSLLSSPNGEESVKGFNAIFKIFLENVASLSASRLAFRLYPSNPKWLVHQLLNFLDLHQLPIISITAGSSSSISRKKFEGRIENYLPALVAVDLSRGMRSQVQEVLDTPDSSL